MSQSNNNSDDPLFIMHIGATYAVRISVLHGTSHGLMALPVHGVVRVRLQGGRGNDAQEIDVSTLSEEIGKWDGFGIWDTSTHAQPLADRPAQQIKADLTFRLRMKVQHPVLMLDLATPKNLWCMPMPAVDKLSVMFFWTAVPSVHNVFNCMHCGICCVCCMCYCNVYWQLQYKSLC